MTECTVSFCHKPHFSKGLCAAHYMARRRGLAMKPVRPRKQPQYHCDVPGCDGNHYAHGLCGMHWQRGRKAGCFDLEVVSQDPIDLLGEEPPLPTPEEIKVRMERCREIGYLELLRPHVLERLRGEVRL